MKTITLLALAAMAFVSLSQPLLAGPRGGGGGFGGGGHFGGGGRAGGFAGGGSRAAPAFHGGGFGTAPAFRSSGAYFTGRSVGRVSGTPRFYYTGNRMAAVPLHGLTRSVSRSTSPSAGRITAANRQAGRVGSIAGRNRILPPRNPTATNRQSIAGQNRISNPRTSTAANRESFLRNHVSERHAANWHRDWDRHHAHFHNNRVFVFVDGFWWGLYPWDYYPYYSYGYPYDYGDYQYDYSGYPYDYGYSGDPYGYYSYYPYNDDDEPAYGSPDQSAANATVSAVQSRLAKLGYYNGAIDGLPGDETEAALARYQQDHDISVTGSLNAATLYSLGVK